MGSKWLSRPFVQSRSQQFSPKFSDTRLLGYKAKRKGAYDFIWTSKFSHLCVTMCMLLDPLIFCTELFTHQLKGSSDPLYGIILFAFVMPILYVEIFIGQYTQLCCFHYGKMLPLLHGLGAVKMIMNFYILIQVLMYSATTTYYFLLTISEPWERCDEEWKNGCLTFQEILNCIKPSCANATIYNLSTYLFYRHIQEHKHLEKILITVAFAIIAYITVLLGYHCYRYIITFSFISMITTTTVMVLVIIAFKSNVEVNLSKTVASAITLRHTTLKGVGNSITRPLITMNLAAAGHILYGTHLSTQIKTTVQTFLICVVYLICVGIGSFLIRLSQHSLTSAVGWDELQLSSREMLYVTFHDFVQDHFKKNGFPLVFDLCCLVLLFTKQVIHMDIITETLSGYFTLLEPHRPYVVSAVASIGLLSVIPYFLVSEITIQTVDTIYEFGSLIIIEIEIAAVMYIYSYALFCDDIHFTFGSQPAGIWKAFWICLPIIQIIGLLMYSDQTEKSVVTKVLLTISLSPLVIGALYKLIKGIKVKNVLGLFMPEEAWGMRNTFQRKLRRIYNPREETHSQTRDARCKHNCLLDSEILNNVVRDEIESTKLETVQHKQHNFEDVRSFSTSSEENLSSDHLLKNKA